MDSNRGFEASYCNQLHRTRLIRLMFLIVIFALFLYPLSVKSLSINYSFALYPIILLLLGKHLRKPSSYIVDIAVLFTIILFVAFIYQYQFYDLMLRRFVSFVLFMTLFTFVFVRIDQQMINAFKIAVIFMSAAVSFITIIKVLTYTGPLHYEAKNLFGSQRYGFIYIIGFWLLLLYKPASWVHSLMRFATLIIISGGLLLTFSRASVVALVGSLSIYSLVSIWQGIKRPKFRYIIMLIWILIIGSLTILLLYSFLPLPFHYFRDRIIRDFYTGATLSSIYDPEASEGSRIYITQKVIDFVLANPVTGSGYLGIWAFSDIERGSAHNQLNDVLLRVGLFGFIAYGYLIFQLVKYLAKYDKPLFWGFVGVLIYGLCHETFKESQGAFVLAFLYGMMSQSLRTTDTNYGARIIGYITNGANIPSGKV